MRSMATWCVRHRRLVIGSWLLAVTLATVLAGIAGSNFSNTFSLPGTGSASGLFRERPAVRRRWAEVAAGMAAPVRRLGS
jgi:hypothetical protein